MGEKEGDPPPVLVQQNSNGKSIQLTRQWGIFYGIGIVLLCLILLMLSFAIYDNWRATSQGELRTGREWPAVLVAAAVVLLVSCVVLFETWTELKIEFTEVGILKRGYVGSKLICWADITRVTVSGQYVTLYTTNKSIKLNTLYYKDRAAFFQLILDHVPQSAVWGMSKKMWTALKKEQSR